MKAYKGFDKDLKCRDFQYEIGGEYETDTAELCEAGFHACENPLDCMAYYPPIDGNRYAEVELDDVSDKQDGDSKRVGKKIRIKAELSLKDLIRAAVDIMIDKSKSADGNESKLCSDERNAQIGSSGYYARIGSSGYSAQIGSSGDYARIGSSGDYARIGSSGDSAQIGSSGDYARIGSSGDSAQIGSSGDYAVVAAIGVHSIAKAKVGSWLTLAEYEWRDRTDDEPAHYHPVCVKTEYVDGEIIKGDTWYALKDGEFTEVEVDDEE